LTGEKTLSEVMIQGPGGILILPAGSGIQELTALTDEQKLCLLDEFDQLTLPIDILLIDTAAGISSNVIYFTVAAQEIIVVASPEPTSITDAYALMKVLSTRHAERRFNLLVNLAREPQEGRLVHQHLNLVSGKFLNISIDYLGTILMDESLPQAVRQQRMVFDLYPHSKASRGFSDLAYLISRGLPSTGLKGNIQFFWRRLLNAQHIPLSEPPMECPDKGSIGG
jgi:flagellar biosynthesis protein FlhG